MINLRHALKPGGYFIAATFAEDGPEKCSGLEVERYDRTKMLETVGKDFELLDSFRHRYDTPFGMTQNFNCFRFRKR